MEQTLVSQQTDQREHLIRRARLQIVSFAIISVLISALVSFGEYNSYKVDGVIKPMSHILLVAVTYLVGTFSFCFTAAWYFYLGEILLKLSASKAMRVLIAIYNIDLIRVIFVFMAGALTFFITFGLHGCYQFYRAVRLLRSE
jgi:hypothetical protein